MYQIRKHQHLLHHYEVLVLELWSDNFFNTYFIHLKKYLGLSTRDEITKIECDLNDKGDYSS